MYLLSPNMKIKNSRKGQQALEYILLLAIVVAVVLFGFKKYLPQTRNSSELYYNKVAVGILGEPPSCSKLLGSANPACITP